VIEAPSDRRNREVEDHLARRRNSWYLTTVPEKNNVNLLYKHILLNTADALPKTAVLAYMYNRVSLKKRP